MAGSVENRVGSGGGGPLGDICGPHLTGSLRARRAPPVQGLPELLQTPGKRARSGKFGGRRGRGRGRGGGAGRGPGGKWLRNVLGGPRRASGRASGLGPGGARLSSRGGRARQLRCLQGFRADLGGNPVQIRPGGCVDSGALGAGTACPPACDPHDHVGVFRVVSAHERPAAVPLPRRTRGHCGPGATFPHPEGHGLWEASSYSHVVLPPSTRVLVVRCEVACFSGAGRRLPGFLAVRRERGAVLRVRACGFMHTRACACGWV